MARKHKTVLIAGGGLSGLFAALLVSRKYPAYEVVLAERGPALGGLYSSFNAGDQGYFDHGPHIFYESGIEEVDAQLRDVLPDSEWIWLSGNRKDIAGAYFNGRLQTYSHYPDLRALDHGQYSNFVTDFFATIDRANATDRTIESAADYFCARFGEVIASQVVEPILEKTWGRQGRDLDPFAARIVSMDRVILFGATAMSKLMASRLLRERLAYPDQLNLPSGLRVSTQRGFYPKKFGLVTVVAAIRKELEHRGVRILTGASLGAFTIGKGKIDSVSVRSGDEELVLDDLHLVHWTAGLLPLARQLNIRLPHDSGPQNRKLVYVNAVSRLPPKMGETYYFYCHDAGYKTFRITNYAAYCPDAKSKGYRLSLELHFEANLTPDRKEAETIAISEMCKFGLIESAGQIGYIHAEIPAVGIPAPTLSGKKLHKAMRTSIESVEMANLTIGGASPDKDLFFLHDILADSYRVLVEREGWQL